MAEQHALLSPSHAHTWAMCLASPLMEKGVPNPSSPYAEEGTKAHALAESRLRAKYEKGDGLTSDGYTVEMLDNISMYTAFVSDLIDKHPGCFKAFEFPVLLKGVTGEEGAKGTIDCIVCSDDHLWITDLKYGAGVPVTAEKNEQLCIYALGAIDELSIAYDIKDVTLTIVQPRCGGINSWDVSAAALEQFRGNVLPRAKRAIAIYEEREVITDKDYYCEGSVCRWCRGKTKCLKFTETTKQALVADYKEIEDVPAELKTIRVPDDPETLAKAYRLLPVVKSWCDMVQESVSARLGQGERIPGYKLVAGRKGARAWSDAAEVESMMKAMRMKREDMYDFKLISPTKFEAALKANPKLLGKGQIQKLRSCITQSEGKPAVVEESDSRPAITVASGDDYEAISENSQS